MSITCVRRSNRPAPAKNGELRVPIPRSRDETRIYNKNKFKLGLFGMNCLGGLSLTKAPERWDASWDNNVKAAKLADEAGLEFLLPIGRWHGYQGESDTQGTTFETIAWACGLLAKTDEITTFGTLHVAFINPVFAAKQMVTADHIGHGRFGVNVVSGWNAIEFGMMAVTIMRRNGSKSSTASGRKTSRSISTGATTSSRQCLASRSHGGVAVPFW